MRQHNKKGSLPLELLLVLVILFGFALIVFISKTLVDDINTDIQADTDISQVAKTNSANMAARLPTIFDAGFVLLFVLMWIAILFFGYNIDTYPAFFIISIVFLIIVIMIASNIESGYNEFMTDSDFSSMSTSFPMTNFILTHLTVTIAIMSVSLIMVLYGKSQASR